MKIGKMILAAGLLLSAIGTAQAQCVGNFHRILNPNNVSAYVKNQGEQFGNQSSTGQYYIPDTSGLSPIAFSNLWIGGKSPLGQLHLAASELSDNEADFKVGPFRTTAPYACRSSFETATLPFEDGLKTLSNGKVLALDSQQVLIYDPVTKQSITRPWPVPRGWVDALELRDGRILFFGDDSYPTKNPVLLMDTVTYTLSGGTTLHWFHKYSSATELLDGRVLLAGVVGCELWDPTTNQSTAVPDMLYPRMMHAAQRLANGDVMVFGGGTSLNGSGYTLVTQRFDDSLGYWFPGPSLSQGTKNPSAVTMPDGRIYIVGGNETIAISEFYDPVLDTAYPAPSLGIATELCNARLLPDGSVAVAYQYSQFGFGEVVILDPNTSLSRPLQPTGAGTAITLLDGYDAVVNIFGTRECIHLNLRTEFPYDNRWQFIWTMTRAEIDQFRSDYQANQVDFNRYPEIEIWPAHGSVADGEDRLLAPFVDVNGDGLYQPAADGDYPCIVGDQAMWWVLNDQGMHEESGGLPMDLQIEVMAYGFDCNLTPCPDPALNDATFFHYEFSNHSDTTWSDMYVGGYYGMQRNFNLEKFVGTNSNLELAFGYHADNSDDFFYGNRPPAWGSTILPNGQISHMSSMIAPGMQGVAHDRYPANPAEFYEYLQGHWADDLPLVDNGLDGYPGTATGPNAAFAYPSLAGFCGGSFSGWSEVTAASVPGLRSYVQASGPFSLQPGEEIEYDLGFFFAQDSNNIASVCKLQDVTANLRDWWQNQLDRSCWNLLIGTEDARPTAVSLQVVPNPASGSSCDIVFGQGLAENAQLELLDLHGRILQRLAVPQGADRQRIEVAGLPAGVYLARLIDGRQSRSARIVVL